MKEALVQQFDKNVMRAWLLKDDITKARDVVKICIDELDNTQCDLYRVQAALSTTPGPVDDQLLTTMWRYRDTWGDLLRALPRNWGDLMEQIGIPMDQPGAWIPLTVNLGIFSSRTTSRTTTVLYIGYANLLLSQQRYADAWAVIESCPVKTSAVQFVALNIQYEAKRWGDVLDLGQKLLNPKVYDEYDTLTSQEDTYIQALAFMMTGAAFAHLGNFDAAEDRLQTAERVRSEKGTYMAIGAEASYYQGLIAREKGDETGAEACWRHGQKNGVTDKLEIALTDKSHRLRLTTEELIGQRGDYWDAGTEPNLLERRAEQLAASQQIQLAESFELLNDQIGLDGVKTQVRRLRNDVAKTLDRIRRGMEVNVKSYHLVFAGPPGTGKTTIARVVAQIYFGLGIIKKPRVVEVKRADLVGEHLGETAIKTNRKIDEAMDGVLFIDEAYALIQKGLSGGDAFGQEAVDTLLARLENDRDRLIVIIAGYEKELREFIDSNEGLWSRFTKWIMFESYTPEQLGEIAVKMAGDLDTPLSVEGKDYIVQGSAMLAECKIDNTGRSMLDVAGNARFVRNVIEQADTANSDRHGESGVAFSELDKTELYTLSRSDVQQAFDEILDPILGRPTNRSTTEATSGQVQ